MKHLLIVVDIQKDFVDGALGTAEAVSIVENAAKKIEAFDGEIFVTYDTHFENYMNTAEGAKLPVPHCIKGTEGWQLIPPLEKYCTENNCKVYEKLTFGSVELAQNMLAEQTIESIELIGLCTDICVVSNALLLKAFLPEVTIKVDSACCAGVTPEKHAAALETMRSCQILVN